MAKTYAYFSFMEKFNAKFIYEEIKDYCSDKYLKLNAFLSSTEDLRKPLYEREIFTLISKEMMTGDILVVYEAANLGRSICQVIELLQVALSRGVDIHFAKTGLVFFAEDFQRKERILRVMGYVSDEFLFRQTTDAKVRRSKSKIVLGRPKGQGNRKFKLDDREAEIQSYLTLNFSKRSIARILGCHPQTLQDWLIRRKIEVEVDQKEGEELPEEIF